MVLNLRHPDWRLTRLIAFHSIGSAESKDPRFLLFLVEVDGQMLRAKLSLGPSKPENGLVSAGLCRLRLKRRKPFLKKSQALRIRTVLP